MHESFQQLMCGLIDYAGLFPPAALNMAQAVAKYEAHLASPHAWMLGRFICPVSRLGEFEAEARPRACAADPWMISALVGADVEADLDALSAFVDRNQGCFDVPALELKVTRADEIDPHLTALDTLAEGVEAYFEFPLAGDFRGCLTALSGTGCGAKIRTGGVTADAFPPRKTIAKFIIGCRDAMIPFKATAGLHHPIRHYNTSVNTEMHGFFNVFAAATLAHARNAALEELEAVLNAQEAGDFDFCEDGLRLMGQPALSATDIARARRVATSFGSCSFDEPVADLIALQLLSPPGAAPS